MALAAGARLGPYTILGPLAAGGMGEVYRARDDRLGREVAVKVLPEAVRADPGRLRRFEQEARAAGALSHPNVLAVHDFDAAADTPYLVAELLEGATLREHLRRGPPPARAAITWAGQIARGLAAAHGKGIVHRDLKPENIFVTRDGQVKILDFGLAKALHERDEAELAAGGTVTADPSAALTATGAILGTAGYMAPEQVQGRPADPRSDVFSFGAILYELLTGARAFDGETPVEKAYAILKDEPAPLATLGHRLPSELEAVVARCLAKDPAARFASARDLVDVLESLAMPEADPDATPARPARPRSLGRRLAVAAAVIAAGAAALAGAFALGQRRATAPAPPPAPAAAPSPLRSSRLSFRLGAVHAARFAADGHSVVYAAAFKGEPLQVYLATPGMPDARSIAPPDSQLVAVSATGELLLGLQAGDRAGRERRGVLLARAPFGGGEPRQIMSDVLRADFVSDAAGLAVVRRVGALLRLEHPPGRVVDESSMDFPALRLSPAGDRVAYAKQEGDGAWIYLAAAGERPRRVAGPFSGDGHSLSLAFAPDRDELWFSAPERPGAPAALHALPFSREPREPRLLARDLGALVLHDVARDGRALVTLVDRRKRLLARPPGAAEERDLSWFYSADPAGISRDGARVLFVESGEATAGLPWVFLRGTDGAPPVRLAEGDALGLSPDGGWFLHRPALRGRALFLAPTGAGEPWPLPPIDLDPIDARWFPDGRRFLLRGHHKARERIWVVDPDGEAPRPLTEEWTVGEPVISPDGREAAALDPAARLLVFSIEGGAPREIARLDRDDRLVAWAADGKAILVQPLGSAAPPARVDRVDIATGKRAPWQEIAPADPLGVESVGPLHLTPDGRAYAVSCERFLSDLYLVEGLR